MNDSNLSVASTGLRRALDELIDEISEVKQASWVTGGPSHGALTDLKSFLVASVHSIVEGQDEPGRSPFSVLSPSARPVQNLAASAGEDIVLVVADHLALLTEHMKARASAIAITDAAGSKLLAGIAEGLDAYGRVLQTMPAT